MEEIGLSRAKYSLSVGCGKVIPALCCLIESSRLLAAKAEGCVTPQFCKMWLRISYLIHFLELLIVTVSIKQIQANIETKLFPPEKIMLPWSVAFPLRFLLRRNPPTIAFGMPTVFIFLIRTAWFCTSLDFKRMSFLYSNTFCNLFCSPQHYTPEIHFVDVLDSLLFLISLTLPHIWLNLKSTV